LPRNASAALSVFTLSFSDATSLIYSLESRLANSMSADAVELLKQKHAEELQGLQSQAAKAQELEAELTKAREGESKLWLEFDQQLAKEREILSVKYESEADELRVSLEAKVKSRDAKIGELESLRELDGK
jgi:RNA binding exosome subunit